MKQKIMWFSMMVGVFLLTGCTGKLSEVVDDFSDGSIQYSVQLPQTWTVSTDPTEQFNAEAVFGSEDSKSNSYLFVLTKEKTAVELDGLGERTREELQERYNLDDVEDVPMEEFEVAGRPAYKYTLETVYEGKQVWLYFYYVETEHSLVQFVVYSAADNQADSRSELIDQSVKTLKETGVEAETEATAEQIIIKNEQLVFDINGILALEEGGKSFVAVRYKLTNLGSEESVTPSMWAELMQVSQGEQQLSLADNPADAKRLDFTELVENQERIVAKGEVVESVVFYELKDETDILIQPDQAVFPDTEVISLVLP